MTFKEKVHTDGVDSGEDPPVPISNTEVKLTCAENTCLETGRKDRYVPSQMSFQRTSKFLLVLFFVSAELMSLNFHRYDKEMLKNWQL